MTRTILCPVDFSNGSMRALDKAYELARALGAELEILHVYHIPMYGLPLAQEMITPSLRVEVTEKAQAALASLKATVGPDVPVTTKLIEGYPAEAVVDRARELGAEMVVMSTHGRQGFRRFLLGSVTERVVRMSTVPVLTVHSSDAEEASQSPSP
jgi:nucleotide-binding universal stress UspA family protein